MGDDDGGYYQIEAQPGYDSTILMEACRFHSNSYVDIDLTAGDNVELVAKDCRFVGPSVFLVICNRDGGNPIGLRTLNIQGCSFHTQTGGGSAVHVESGDRVELSDNVFRNASDALTVASAAGVGRLQVSNNDFSQGGTSLGLAGVPSEWRAEGNFGSVGFKSRSGGQASVVNGDTIAHGLGSGSASITPTRFSLEPRVARRVAAVTGVSSSALTVALHDDGGSAITSAENVQWWAEQ